MGEEGKGTFDSPPYEPKLHPYCPLPQSQVSATIFSSKNPSIQHLNQPYLPLPGRRAGTSHPLAQICKLYFCSRTDAAAVLQCTHARTHTKMANCSARTVVHLYHSQQ